MADEPSSSTKRDLHQPAVSPFFIKASQLIGAGVLQRPVSSGINPGSGFTFASAKPFQPNLFGRNLTVMATSAEAQKSPQNDHDEDADVDPDDDHHNLADQVRELEQRATPDVAPDPFKQKEGFRHLNALNDTDFDAATTLEAGEERQQAPASTECDAHTAIEVDAGDSHLSEEKHTLKCCDMTDSTIREKPTSPDLFPDGQKLRRSHSSEDINPTLNFDDETLTARSRPVSRRLEATENLSRDTLRSALDLEGTHQKSEMDRPSEGPADFKSNEAETTRMHSRKRDSMDSSISSYSHLTYEQLLEALEFKRKDAATSNVRKYQAMVRSFEQALANATNDHTQSEMMAQQLEAELCAERSLVKQVRRQLDQAKSQNNALSRSNTDLLAKEAEAKSISRRQSRDHSNTRAELKQSNSDRGRLRNELELAHSRIEALMTDLTRLKENETAMRLELSSLNALRHSLDHQLGEKSAMLTEERDGKLRVCQQLDKALAKYSQMDIHIDELKMALRKNISESADGIQQRQTEAQNHLMSAFTHMFTQIKDGVGAAVSTTESYGTLIRSISATSTHSQLESKDLAERVLLANEATSAQLRLGLDNLQSAILSDHALSHALERSQSRADELQKKVEAAAAETCSWTAKFESEYQRAERARSELVKLNSSLQRVFGPLDTQQSLETFLRKRMDEVMADKTVYESSGVQTDTESTAGMFTSLASEALAEDNGMEDMAGTGKPGSSAKHGDLLPAEEIEMPPSKRQKRAPRAKKKG